MYIETKRLIIRNFMPDDENDLFQYFGQKDVVEKGGNHVHKEISETRDMLQKWVSDGIHNAIVWKMNGKVIGHISIKKESEENRADTRELGCA